jgi:para-nitrobenzyl esterase
MQKPGPLTRAPAFSEDCLTVNLWTKANSVQGKSPVMVFVYGGGFINGSGSASVHLGAHRLLQAFDIPGPSE